jgi:hypothetical protein
MWIDSVVSIAFAGCEKPTSMIERIFALRVSRCAFSRRFDTRDLKPISLKRLF